MTRTEIRTFLETAVNALTPTTEFGSGRLSEFASIRNHQYPAVWQNIKPVSGELKNSAPLDKWEIELIIAQKDSADSLPEQYEEIIDHADLIAQKLTYQYRNVTPGYKLIAMDNPVRTPFVKELSPDCISGVRFTFTLTVQDKTNVC